MTKKIDLKISFQGFKQIDGVVILINEDLLNNLKNSDNLWEDFFKQIGQQFDRMLKEDVDD